MYLVDDLSGGLFIGRDFVEAAFLSAGKYSGKSYLVTGLDNGPRAIVAADTGDKAQAIFNAVFKRKNAGVSFQRHT